MVSLSLYYIPCSSKKEAITLGKKLLTIKLVGCINIIPMSSSYWWKGRICTTSEILLLAKGPSKNYGQIKKVILQHHLYDTPCIGKLKFDCNKSYLKWLLQETTAPNFTRFKKRT